MPGYITVGANDVPRFGRFYAAVLTPLGYTTEEGADGFAFTAPDMRGWGNGPGAVYVKKPFDGQAASVGNGSMTAFEVGTHAMVRAVHAAGLAAGGSDEGAPGFRDDYSDNFYVAYLRDPLGNKIAIFCADPAQGTRGG